MFIITKMLINLKTYTYKSVDQGLTCWVCFSEFCFGGGGGEWLPFHHVIAVWKVCFWLLISSLAKLGVFYTLTHFGMEKYKKKKKKLTVLFLWHGIYPLRLREEEGGMVDALLPYEEYNRMSTPFKI